MCCCACIVNGGKFISHAMLLCPGTIILHKTVLFQLILIINDKLTSHYKSI